MHTHARSLQPHYWLAGDYNMALGLYWCTLSDRSCTLLLSSYRVVVRAHMIVTLCSNKTNLLFATVKCIGSHWAPSIAN
jgi:hypothetical protein